MDLLDPLEFSLLDEGLVKIDVVIQMVLEVWDCQIAAEKNHNLLCFGQPELRKKMNVDLPVGGKYSPQSAE